MNILLTNDDGYEAEGIKTLYKVLSKEHQVFIIAPESNRSAVSHHLSMYTSNKIVNIQNNIWSHSGYPVDCVFTGLKSELINEKIDLVISGINKGENLGTDIIYSGTCAASRESVLLGIPSIAVSLHGTPDFNYEAIANFILKNLCELIKLSDTQNIRTFLNVNAFSLDSYKGIKYTTNLCKRKFDDKSHINIDMTTKFLPGQDKTIREKDNDLWLCEQGYIVLSKIYADPIACELVDDMKISL